MMARWRRRWSARAGLADSFRPQTNKRADVRCQMSEMGSRESSFRPTCLGLEHVKTQGSGQFWWRKMGMPGAPAARVIGSMVILERDGECGLD